MKRARLWLAAAVAVGLAGGSLAFALTPDDPEVVELLTGISFTPSRSNIDLVMGNAALEDLILIAQDESPNADIGLRIRAYRALGVYETSDNRQLAVVALREAVLKYTDSDQGEGVLYLRASMLSLAQLAREQSVNDIINLLSHESRDIRAASAQALGITGSSLGVQALRDQALIEDKTQVKLAIEDALFELTE